MADVGGIAGDQLRSIVDRIEQLEEEKAALAADIREVYGEAKANGFEPKVLRQVVRLRKLDHTERLEQEALFDLYMLALEGAPTEERRFGGCSAEEPSPYGGTALEPAISGAFN